nr:cytochrome oxidase putative small subunit CydP [uncultured Rhodoferax sp.]
MTSPTDAPEHIPKRWHQRLRRELIWAIALKLVVLFSLKAAFFPHRLPASEAAQGVAERIASSRAPTHEPLSKDQP